MKNTIFIFNVVFSHQAVKSWNACLVISILSMLIALDLDVGRMNIVFILVETCDSIDSFICRHLLACKSNKIKTMNNDFISIDFSFCCVLHNETNLKVQLKTRNMHIILIQIRDICFAYLF